MLLGLWEEVGRIRKDWLYWECLMNVLWLINTQGKEKFNYLTALYVILQSINLIIITMNSLGQYFNEGGGRDIRH